MGRAKLRMEMIQNQRTRLQTFNKRLAGLKKKATELSVLCNIQVCLIIYGPNAGPDTPPETWSANPDGLQAAIDAYLKQPAEGRAKRNSNLLDFLKRKNEEAASRNRRKVRESKFPPWDPRIAALSKAELAAVADKLEKRIEGARTRLGTMREDQRLREMAALVGMDPNGSINGNGFDVAPKPDFQIPLQYYVPPNFHLDKSYDPSPPGSLTMTDLLRMDNFCGGGHIGGEASTIETGILSDNNSNGDSSVQHYGITDFQQWNPTINENLVLFNELKPSMMAMSPHFAAPAGVMPVSIPPFLQLPVVPVVSQAQVPQVSDYYGFGDFDVNKMGTL